MAGKKKIEKKENILRGRRIAVSNLSTVGTWRDYEFLAIPSPPKPLPAWMAPCACTYEQENNSLATMDNGWMG